MPRLRLDLDRETFDALADKAFSERRPVPLQAEVILRQALGLEFPYPNGDTPGPSPLHGPRLPHG
jgi:hypothetical protein